MSKRLVFVIVIILLIVGGVFLAKKISEEEENIQTTGEMVNELVDDIDIVLDGNNTSEQIENEVIENTAIDEKENTEKPEEKAIKIVKQNWGEDDSVYYSYDGVDSQGRYIICVRDKNTTKALYFYYVDIETGTFDID